MNSIAPYWKAIVAFITPGLVALGIAIQDTSPGGSMITPAEWLGILIACFATAGVVFAVPNKDPQGTNQSQSVQPPGA